MPIRAGLLCVLLLACQVCGAAPRHEEHRPPPLPALPTAEPGADFPKAVRVLMTGEVRIPCWLFPVCAGSVAQFRLGFPVFEIVYADGRNVLVDAPITDDYFRHGLRRLATPDIHLPQREAYPKAAARARALIFTHEHEDHLIGLNLLPESRVREKAWFSAEQLESSRFEWTRRLHPLRGKLNSFHFDEQGRHRVAPGVTLLRMPGHTPGSLAVHVKLQDGAEYLLIGDTSYSMALLDRHALNPWVVSRLFAHEDRHAMPALHAELRRVRRERNLVIVPSHDAAYIEGMVSPDGLLTAPK